MDMKTVVENVSYISEYKKQKKGDSHAHIFGQHSSQSVGPPHLSALPFKVVAADAELKKRRSTVNPKARKGKVLTIERRKVMVRKKGELDLNA
jgi:hypothetical protein